MKYSRSKKGLIDYYNQLIFRLAYPSDEKSLVSTENEIHEFSEYFMDKDTTFINRFNDSGLPSAPVYGFFTIRLLKQLLDDNKVTLTLEYFSEDGIHPKNLLEFLLPDIEYELIGSGENDKLEYLQNIANIKSKSELIGWLVTLFCKNNFSEKIICNWFDQLKLVVSIRSESIGFSKGYLKVDFAKPYFHKDGILKRFDAQTLIHSPLSEAVQLDKLQITKLIKLSQYTLTFISRETDPITYNNPKQVRYFNLDRGFSIALFGLDSDKSLPLEFYVGYMMYKNGYPISYGGAWIFGKRALIGIHIFEAFRGGESSYLFCQIMRTYSQFFRIDYFEVEPYQFGLNNKEGIQSGAFWFYYRLGYRPQDRKLAKLAEKEFLKISKTKSYRSPEKILKLFTESYLELRLSTETRIPQAASDWSSWISHYIQQQFAGKRWEAIKTAKSILNIHLKGAKFLNIRHKGFQKLGLFFAFAVDWSKINDEEKELIFKILMLKQHSEIDCALEWSKFSGDYFLNLN